MPIRRTHQNHLLKRFDIPATLDFVETGEYYVYVETASTLDEIRGDCDLQGTYDLGSISPQVDVTIIDPDGSGVDVDDTVADADPELQPLVEEARTRLQEIVSARG